MIFIVSLIVNFNNLSYLVVIMNNVCLELRGKNQNFRADSCAQ